MSGLHHANSWESSMELQNVKNEIASGYPSLIYSIEKVDVCFKNKCFDRAMDAKYITDHIGGSYHRLFDGNHDIIGAWKATGTVSENHIDHFFGWLKGLWNDAITPRGLPYVSISKDTYQKIHTVTNIPKSELHKLLSWTPQELITVGVGVPSVITKTTSENILLRANIAGFLTVSTVTLHSVPSGIVASIIMVKIASFANKNKETSKDVTASYLKGFLLAILFQVNPVAGLATVIAIPLYKNRSKISRNCGKVVAKFSNAITNFLRKKDKKNETSIY